MLQKLHSGISQKIQTRVCELCGIQIDVDRELSIMVVIATTGKPNVAAFKCEYEQHWACSIEHLRVLGHACVDEHAIELLKEYHNANTSH